MYHKASWLACTVFVGICVPSLAQAQTTWYVDDCPGAGSGSQADPFCLIQEGIDAAVDGDTVQVADGTYTGIGNKNLSFDGKAITVQSENGPENCIIDCEGAGRGVRFVNQETVSSVLQGLTILDGNVATSGGGILCVDSSPTITNCWIKGNTSFEFGGGIACVGSGSPVISNCLIDLNSAGFGGGIGCVDPNCNPFLTDSAIRFNTASRFGGGLYTPPSGSSLTIHTCTFLGNEAVEAGGGLYVWWATVVDSSITDNLSFDVGGGIFSDLSVTMSGTDISDNLALGHGGGMHIFAGSFTDCRIVGNFAGSRGGGVYSGNETSLTRCVVSNNFSTGNGGGVFFKGGASDAILTNCIVSGNEANVGGGVNAESRNFNITGCTFWANVAASGGGAVSVAGGEAVLSNSIFWADEAEVGPELHFEDDATVLVEYCDVDGEQGPVHTDFQVQLSWVQNIDTDPLLLDPAGSDFHLTVNSPCIDAGVPSFSPEPGETDLDGEPRVFNDRVDIGSDEFHDCNANMIADLVELEQGTASDCNNNSIPDECDIASSESDDANEDGVPDECPFGDVNGDGETNLDDLTCLLDALSGVFNCPGVNLIDLDVAPCGGDGDVNLFDLLALLDALAGWPICT